VNEPKLLLSRNCVRLGPQTTEEHLGQWLTTIKNGVSRKVSRDQGKEGCPKEEMFESNLE
jgi:hypothetical protein